jgi:S1-C subfamily serine protease
VITDLGVTGAGPPAPAPGSPDEEPEDNRRHWNTPRTRRIALLVVALVWAVAITAIVLSRGGDSAAPVAAPPKPSASPSDGPLSVAEVFQTLAPSVVRIESDGEGRDHTEQAIGTGVIVNADGSILTARHVVHGAGGITVTYADGTSSAAKIATEDAKQDIATITPVKLPETLVPAALGGGAGIGDDVVAIGNPLGLTFSTTSGVVSGLNRTTQGASGAMTGLIQFDAAVNPGSSGGPLIDDHAQVIGIVVSLANPTSAGTFIGIGFAVPIGAALGGGTGDGRAPPL